MPVEIKELHIRVAVDASPPGQSSVGPSAASATPSAGSADRDTIVAECVEQVMHILQVKGER